MCQGAICSLIQFKVGGKTKRIVLTGIGSHSNLVADNKKKLERLGWREDSKGQKVFSIESDFSAWNMFTVESEEPSKTELKILTSAYKKIAGSPSALLRHVKRCGKIDDALLRLLTAPALEAYNKATAQAWIELFSIKTNRVKHLQ